MAKPIQLQPSEHEAITDFLCKLRNYQEPTDLSIPQSAFRALCREILYHETRARGMDSDFLYEGVWRAFQEITEAWMMRFFKRMQTHHSLRYILLGSPTNFRQGVDVVAKNADRKTIQAEDFECIKGVMMIVGLYPPPPTIEEK